MLDEGFGQEVSAAFCWPVVSGCLQCFCSSLLLVPNFLIICGGNWMRILLALFRCHYLHDRDCVHVHAYNNSHLITRRSLSLTLFWKFGQFQCCFIFFQCSVPEVLKLCPLRDSNFFIFFFNKRQTSLPTHTFSLLDVDNHDSVLTCERALMLRAPCTT